MMKDELIRDGYFECDKYSGMLVRGMDHWGIISGELLEKAARIECMIRAETK